MTLVVEFYLNELNKLLELQKRSLFLKFSLWSIFNPAFDFR